MPFVKKRKPVTKRIWSLLKYMPSFIRKHFVRSQFEISYDLSRDYTFKIAETEDEVEQALHIVYDSYSSLGYIDECPEKMHFNAFLCLPTTSILIIKYKEEVVGTMSIVPDSSFGLPSESTWDLSHIKAKNPQIGEISSLTIKKSHKTSRGHLLLTLCKLMYEFNMKLLHLDGVVLAATVEVEPFYTDLLLFKKVIAHTGQEHGRVKGNKSTCCFLNFNKAWENYVKEYGRKEKKRNLFYFFTKFNSPNIQLPKDTISVQGLLYNKHRAMVEVLEKFPTLKKTFSSEDKRKLSNMDPTFHLEHAIDFHPSDCTRSYPRINVKHLEVHVFHPPTNKMVGGILTDVSAHGYGLKISESISNLGFFDKCLVIFNSENTAYSISGRIQWCHDQLIGCVVMENSKADWNQFIGKIFEEVHIPVSYHREVEDNHAV